MGAIALALIVLLFTPARVRFAYDRGDVTARASFGPVKIPLYPREEKPAGKKKSGRSKPAAKKKPAGEKKKLSVNFRQILYSLETLPPILGRALGRLGSRVRVSPLKVHVLVAGEDPAKTAMLYGRLQGALGAALPQIHRVIRIQEQDIQLFPDFREEKMDVIADVGVSIRLWDVLVIALCAGASGLKWLIGFRKLADNAAEDDNTVKKSAEDAADVA